MTPIFFKKLEEKYLKKNIELIPIYDTRGCVEALRLLFEAGEELERKKHTQSAS